MVKSIGILTSGGDAPGMNAAVRAVARACLNKGIEVYGVEQGFKGLYEGTFIKFDRRTTRNIINQGGTMLRSARFPEFKDEEVRKVAVKQLEKAGIEQGLPQKVARLLAREVIYGAGKMLHEQSTDASELRQNVTSPGGTTAAALSVLMREEAFPKIIPEAVTAAVRRAGELAC